jgi:lysozyme
VTPSPACANLIKSFESCRLVGYLPTPNDVPTNGWGATGPDIHVGQHWTQAQADARFASDLAAFGVGVSRAIGDAPTLQREYDAMVSFAFNMGLAAFAQSTLLKFHKAGDHRDAANQFQLWVHQGAKVLPGLVRRRLAERDMYLGASQ